MAKLSAIRESFETRLSANYSTTVIKWDNDNLSTPKKSWIRATLIPFPTKNASLGPLHKRYRGIFWVQVFTKLLTGTEEAYEIAEEIESLFSNKNFDEVVCYAAEISRVGNEGKGWFQLNVKVHFWSDEVA